MSTKDRKSIENAIWLCSNCSIEIDKDEIRHTVSLLNSWKSGAEILASRELGKRLPGENDQVDTVVAAITGISKRYLASAIENVHKATEKSLEALDNRFVVKSLRTSDGNILHVSAKENVSLQMNIQNEYKSEYLDKYARFVDHGNDIEISVGAIKFSGSALVEELFNKDQNGVMKISRAKIAGVQKISIINKTTADIENLDDIHGVITFGNKSTSFEGAGLGGMLKLGYTIESSNITSKMTFDINFCKWDGCDVRHLPYFSKLYSMFDKLANGWKLIVTLEVDGKTVLTGEAINLDQAHFVREVRSAFFYIENVFKISEYFENPIKFQSGIYCNRDSFMRVAEVANVVSGERIHSRTSLSSNASCKLVLGEDPDVILQLVRSKDPINISFREDNNDCIECFGQIIELTKMVVFLDGVIPKISPAKDTSAPGDTINVEWVPSENFTYRVEYE